jgi:hypothetical protein
MEVWTWSLLGKHPTTWATPPAFWSIIIFQIGSLAKSNLSDLHLPSNCDYRHKPLCLAFCCCYCFFETKSGYVVQANLEFVILLPQPSKCWDYRCAPPCTAHAFLFKRKAKLPQDTHSRLDACLTSLISYGHSWMQGRLQGKYLAFLTSSTTYWEAPQG